MFVIKYGSCRPEGIFVILMIKEMTDHFQNLTKVLNLKGVWSLKENGYATLQKLINVIVNRVDYFFTQLLLKTSTKLGLTTFWKHKKSLPHLKSCLIFEQLFKEKCVSDFMLSEIKKEANIWRKVLHRLLYVTLILAICNLPFKSHNEKVYEGKAEGVNFLSIIQLLATYYLILHEYKIKQHIQIDILALKFKTNWYNLFRNKLKQKYLMKYEMRIFFR